MANTLYEICRKRYAEGAQDWRETSPGVMSVHLISTASYTFDATDPDIREFVPGAKIAGPVDLAGATVTTNGAVDANDVTFTAVSGVAIQAILIYRRVSGDDTVSYLQAWIDTATGLPITPNGGDIIVTWDNGNTRIFRL